METFTLFWIAITILAVFLLGNIIWLYVISMRWKKFMRTPAGTNIEQTIAHIKNEISQLHDKDNLLKKYSQNLDERLSGSVRGISTVRYDAFPDMGGKQSFVTTLISENGDGTIISSIHSRARIGIYAKPLQNFTSPHELSPEEAQSLKQAKDMMQKKS